MGKLLIMIGGFLLVLGLIISYAPGLISWFGNLPGDIKIVDERRSIFIPITSMIVISLVLSILINLFSSLK